MNILLTSVAGIQPAKVDQLTTSSGKAVHEVANMATNTIDAAANTINITSNIPSTISTNSLSFLDMFLQAGFIVQAVIVILILISIWSWSIIFDKIINFKIMRYKMKSFEDNFWSGKSLDEIFERLQKYKENHPLAQIFIGVFEEYNLHIRNSIKIKIDNSTIKDRMAQIVQLECNKALDVMEGGLTFLATIGNASVFIGLFGTVWGIMQNFQAIAVAQNATLAVVAPGIAEALLATAFGLIAAIPAYIYFNKFSKDINGIYNQIDNFQLELSTMIFRELDKH